MNVRYLYLSVVFLVAIMTGCRDDFSEMRDVKDPTLESESVITLFSERTDGIIRLAVDALPAARSSVWIDLNGDGIREANGSEDVKIFNSYLEYTLAPGVEKVSVYGDVTYFGGASNELTGIDVSGNPFLTALNVPLNRLTSVNVSKNPLLLRFDCSDNRIASLDLSSNSELISLWAFNNELTSMNLSGNGKLTLLDCSGNKLNALDISGNTMLKQLLCYNNELSSLNVSNNERLHRLWLFGNPMCDAPEAEKLLSSLKVAVSGDLWIGDVSLEESTVSQVSAKGWTLQ